MTMPSATSAIPATATMTRPAVRGQHVRGVIPRGGVTGSRPGAVYDEHQGADECDGIADAVNQCPDPVALGQFSRRTAAWTNLRTAIPRNPMTRIHNSRYPNGLAAIASMAPARSGS
jgi:hypothetical protein